MKFLLGNFRLAPILALLFLLVPATGQAADTNAMGVDANLEYRTRGLYINPFELSGTAVRDGYWVEQRLRSNLRLHRNQKVSLTLQLDALDGVLFGDNGTFGQVPAPNAGLTIASKRPNEVGWGIGLRPGADPLDADSYIPVLEPRRAIQLNHIYGDAVLPLGLLRIGRQPMKYGPGITVHDGSRSNRWGVSSYSDIADRVLFATKLDQVFQRLAKGKSHVFNASMDEGIFLAVFYDWMSQGTLDQFSDDLGKMGFALQWKQPELKTFGLCWRDILLSANVVSVQNDSFDTDIYSFPLQAQAGLGPFWLQVQYTLHTGSTREVSEGFAVLSNGEPHVQDLHASGMQAILDYKAGPVTLTFEVDYASGDDDPRPDTPITSFTFARDSNVGLLLFEHIMAFESARSAAVGMENLNSLDAPSFPLTEISTEGRFTNAFALFPQLRIDWVDGPTHKFHTRLGALFAWPAADGGVVDPIATILAEDGNDISDDAVNFHGGKPGDYYGTEIDLQMQWTYHEYFLWTLEGAVLLPGSSLKDEHGHGVTSFLIESRFLYRY